MIEAAGINKEWLPCNVDTLAAFIKHRQGMTYSRDQLKDALSEIGASFRSGRTSEAAMVRDFAKIDPDLLELIGRYNKSRIDG